MPKIISTELNNHLQEECTTLAFCWRIIRTDGTEYFFTDHDLDIVFESNTYKSDAGFSRTAISNKGDFSTDNLDILGLLDDTAITKTDIRAGKFDYAEIFIFIVNHQDLSQGSLKMRRGYLGQINSNDTDAFVAELRGLSQLLNIRTGQVYQAECRADLGDSRCKVPVQPNLVQRSTIYNLGDFVRVSTSTGTTQSQYENRIYEVTVEGTTDAIEPTFDTTVNNETVDGTVTFTAREAWTRHGIVDTVISRNEFTLTAGFDEVRAVDDYFNEGGLAFETGDNTGRGTAIKDWTQSTRTVTLKYNQPFEIQVGDLVKLYPGCQKTRSNCNSFSIPFSLDFPTGKGNIENYRGEPFIPGSDQLTRYPDAQR